MIRHGFDGDEPRRQRIEGVERPPGADQLVAEGRPQADRHVALARVARGKQPRRDLEPVFAVAFDRRQAGRFMPSAERAGRLPQEASVGEDAEEVDGIAARHLARPRRNPVQQRLHLDEPVDARRLGRRPIAIERNGQAFGGRRGRAGAQRDRVAERERHQHVAGGPDAAQDRALDQFHHRLPWLMPCWGAAFNAKTGDRWRVRPSISWTASACGPTSAATARASRGRFCSSTATAC
jgi:hypothetical protein